MAGVVATPVVAYSTTSSWIAAPAIGQGDFAWLEVGRNDGNVRTVAAFRGDRLIVRTAGKNATVVDQPCDTTPCNVVQAPVTGATGVFAYAVAFPGTGGYVASVGATGASNLVAEDTTDPAAITTPHLVATTGSAVVWVDNNRILIAPNVGGTAAILVTAEQSGGEITSLSASAAGIAWSARTVARGTMVGFRAATGELSIRAQEPTAAKATLYSVAVADDGTIVANRRTLRKRRQQLAVVAYAPDGTARTLLKSVPFSRQEKFEVTRPSVAGGLVAVRRREGQGGGRDALWVVNLATGKKSRVAAVKRSTSRLSDPAFGGGRLVWARTDLSGSRLLRSRVYSAAVRR
jgi:hypothetical protein